jgi:MSHA biogenesis protein MshL
VARPADVPVVSTTPVPRASQATASPPATVQENIEQVQSALLPPLPTATPRGAIAVAEPRFDFRVREAPAREVFQALASGSRFNWVIHPEVAGAITVDLRGVTVEDALRAIREGYGYEFSIEANRIAVLPAAMQSRIYQVNYPPSGAGDGFWRQLSDNLRAIVGKDSGREIAVNTATGVVVARGMPAELRQVERYLAAVHASVGRQVVVEAKFVEITLSSANKSGINWSAMGAGAMDAAGRGSLLGFPTAENDFDAMLQRLARQGEARVLSSLRVTALNNQRALLRLGETPAGRASAGATSGGVELALTPQISEDALVTLRVRPTLNVVASRARAESDSVIQASDQTISVIGGLLNLDTSPSGNAREWVILLKPIIVNTGAISEGATFRRDATVLNALSTD